MRCGACGAELPENGKFCDSCGAQLSKKVYCINCGVELGPRDTFCGECGASQAPPPPAPAPPPFQAPSPPSPQYRPAVHPPAPGTQHPTTAFPPPTAQYQPAPAGSGGRSLLPLVIGGVAAVLVLAAGGFFFLQSQGGSKPPAAGATSPAAPSPQAVSYSAPLSTAEPTRSGAAATAPPTATVDTRPTATFAAASTATASARASSTAQAGATATAVARATAAVAPTVQAAATASAYLTRNTTRMKGVLAGNLEPREDGKLATATWAVDMRDFSVEGRFFNPYDRAERGWDYGILFRGSDETDSYRLSVHSDGEWVLDLASPDGGQPQVETVAKGRVPLVDLSATGSNVLKLVVGEKTGYFYCNSSFVATLDLSEQTESGNVALFAGLFPHHTIMGKLTRYVGFDLWSLE